MEVFFMPKRKGSKGALRRAKARKSSDERKSERKAVGRLCLKGKAPSPTRKGFFWIFFFLKIHQSVKIF